MLKEEIQSNFLLVSFWKTITSLVLEAVFWYKTKKELQHAIQNDLIDAVSNDTSDDIAAVKVEISSCIGNYNSDDLLNNLNALLGGLELQLQFIGSFEDLCKGKNEWSKYFREQEPETRKKLYLHPNNFSCLAHCFWS